MLLLLPFLICICGLLVMMLGNVDTGAAVLAGVVIGFVLWLVIGFVMLIGSAFDDCNSLDADDMCVDFGNGEVR